MPYREILTLRRITSVLLPAVIIGVLAYSLVLLAAPALPPGEPLDPKTMTSSDFVTFWLMVSDREIRLQASRTVPAYTTGEPCSEDAYPDSVFVVSPAPKGAPSVEGTEGRVLWPDSPDTLAVKIEQASCGVYMKGSLLALHGHTESGRGVLIRFRGSEDSLPGMRVRSGHGHLEIPVWIQQRLVAESDVGPITERLAREEAERQTRIDAENQARAARAEAERRRRAAIAEAAREEARAARFKELRQLGWSSATVDLIVNGQIRIGMTARMVRESWGRPNDINRTITATGVREQWVYGGGRYVYLEDGVVVTIQT